MHNSRVHSSVIYTYTFLQRGGSSGQSGKGVVTGLGGTEYVVMYCNGVLYFTGVLWFTCVLYFTVVL